MPVCRIERTLGQALVTMERSGSRPATSRRPARTSSGRTAGVAVPYDQLEYRTRPGLARDLGHSPTRHRRSSDSTAAGSRTCAAPSWSCARPRPRRAARNAATAALGGRRGHAGQPDPPVGWPRGGRRATPSACRRTSSDVEARRQRRVERGAHDLRVATRGERRSRGTRPRWRRRSGAAPAYEILGCGLKPEEYAIGTAARTQRPLERPREVAVAGEAQPAALGVADPQPLDAEGGLLRSGCSRHRHSDRR